MSLRGSLACGLPTTVCGGVPSSHTGPALPLAAPDDEVGSFVGVVLRAVRPVRRLAAADVHALRNGLKVGHLDAIAMPTAPSVNMVNRQTFRNGAVLANPCFPVGIAATSDDPVPVTVVRPLPAQAARFRVAYGRRVVIQSHALWRRTAAPGGVPAFHRAVHAGPAPLDRGSASGATNVNGVSEPGRSGTGGRAEALLRPACRVVRPVGTAAAFAFPGDVHSRHRTESTCYRSQPVMIRTGSSERACTTM